MDDIRDGHYSLGKAYLSNAQYDQAIPQFEIVTRLAPDFIEAHHALALAYFGQLRLQEAKNAAQAALKLDPHYEPALSFLQAIVPQDTNMDAAKVARAETTAPDIPVVPQEDPSLKVARAETTAPDIPVVPQEDPSLPVVDTDKELERGLIFLNNKQYAQAEAAFKKVLKSDSQNAHVHYNLARTYLEMGALNDAQSEVDISLRLSPHYQPAHQLQTAITFVQKRNIQQQRYKKMKRYLVPIAIVAVIGFIGFNIGWFSTLLPEKIPPDLSIDVLLEDPTNNNGYIDAGEHVRLKLTLTNSGSTAKGVKVSTSPKSIVGLRYEIPDKEHTILKNGFKTIRIPITADNQARTKRVSIDIQVLDKTQRPIAKTVFHLNIKSK